MDKLSRFPEPSDVTIHKFRTHEQHHGQPPVEGTVYLLCCPASDPRPRNFPSFDEAVKLARAFVAKNGGRVLFFDDPGPYEVLV
jgi:hypothetical protein